MIAIATFLLGALFAASPSSPLLALARAEARSLAPDAKLDRVAARMAELLADPSTGGARSERATVRRFLDIEAATDAQVQPFGVVADVGSRALGKLKQFLEKARQGPAVTHVGIAVTSVRATGRTRGRVVLCAVATRRGVELGELPRTVAAGAASIPVVGQLRAGFASPRLYVTRPAGDVAQPRVHVDANGAFGGRVTLEGGPGPYTVELVVDSALGPEVAALSTVYVDGVLSDSHPREPAATAGMDSEAALYARIDELRAAHGLRPLARDERLERAAAAHARELRRRGYLAHVLGGKSPADRIASALGPSSRAALAKAAENLSMAATLAQAHDNLLGSPSHRANLLDPGLTHVGVAVVRDGGARGGAEPATLYVVEEFAALTSMGDAQGAPGR